MDPSSPVPAPGTTVRTVAVQAVRRIGPVLALALGAAACQPVAFHQKEVLSDEIMAFAPDGTETHFLQKVLYSTEGSLGGIGSTAGGGCGCAN